MSRHQFTKAVASTALTFAALITVLLGTNSAAFLTQPSTVNAASTRQAAPDNTIWG